MSWSEPRRGGRETEEEELRVLLHRAVPALATPEDRMERVLERADRSRRRRRATGLGLGLTGGLLAAVLAAAPAIAPAPDRGAVGPAAERPAGTSSPSNAPTPSVSPTQAGSLVRFPQAEGLTAALPPGWYVQVSGVDGPSDHLGYLANRQFDTKVPCPQEAVFCPPIGALTSDRALLTVKKVGFADSVGTANGESAGMVDIAIDKDCASQNGSRELVGHRGVSLRNTTVRIELTACVRVPSDRTLQQVQQVLESIRVAR
ncbi:hypothetical protein ABZW30_11400 [Kitasatospora sp. NPDC004669]|uniref:hypothetical protein n=1 Tax=Kitasatospora sp. NPDC004669 TaxID=3154555 RepID=UPI0033B5E5B1